MTGSLSPRRPTIPRDERRAGLLRAARDVFCQKGYHATTIDHITRTAGVAKGTFYLYFAEKREIYLDVVSAFLRQVKEICGSVGTADGGADAFFERAERAAHDLLRLFVANREVARLTARESMGLDPALEALVRDFYREIAGVHAANLRRGVELGVFRSSVDPVVTAYAHIGMVERLLLASLDEGSGLPGEPHDIVNDLLRLAFEGIRA